MPNRKALFESAAVKLLIFFMENPDEELQGSDVECKFDVRTNNLKACLQSGVDLGFFAREGGGHGKRVTYMPGPRLLLALRGGNAAARG